MKCFLSILYTLFILGAIFSSIHGFSMSNFMIQSCVDAALCNPHGLRLFHPAFPDEILQPLSIDDVKKIYHMKDMLRIHSDIDHRGYLNRVKNEDLLPWKIFPSIGLAETRKTFSLESLKETYESIKPYGYVVWAHELRKPEKGIVLLNNWKQQVVILSDYEPSRGATGNILDIQKVNDPNTKIYWPPLSLEQEILEKKWQPVRVSGNILSGEVLQYLPPQMVKSVWEMILLLLLSPEKHKEELEAFLDTGLSPQKGMISYIRLLKQIRARSEAWNGIPSYLQISENDVYL